MERVRLATVVGRYLRDVFRPRHNLSQEDIAEAARSCGFVWHRSSVTKLENGARSLSADEFVALPVILATAVMGQGVDNPPAVSLATIIRDATTDFGDRDLILLGESTPLSPDMIASWILGGEGELPDLVVEITPARAPGIVIRSAHNIDVPADAVDGISRLLWGHDFTEEHRRRTAERAQGIDDRNKLRTIAGHVTRQLVEETGGVADAFANLPDGILAAATRRFLRTAGGFDNWRTAVEQSVLDPVLDEDEIDGALAIIDEAVRDIRRWRHPSIAGRDDSGTIEFDLREPQPVEEGTH